MRLKDGVEEFVELRIEAPRLVAPRTDTILSGVVPRSVAHLPPTATQRILGNRTGRQVKGARPVVVLDIELGLLLDSKRHQIRAAEHRSQHQPRAADKVTNVRAHSDLLRPPKHIETIGYGRPWVGGIRCSDRHAGRSQTKTRHRDDTSKRLQAVISKPNVDNYSS